MNVDLVQSPAVDVIADLNSPELPEPGEAFFSHAFFEHLRRDSRIPHLRAVRKAATDEGFACYLGLPDFKRVAEFYLEGRTGAVGPVFDLYNVYRYTHGDLEMNLEESWEPQLHKSLFDVDELGRLLRDAGWSSYVVFRYEHPGEAPGLDLNLGFYATNDQRSVESLEQRLPRVSRRVRREVHQPRDAALRGRPLAPRGVRPCDRSAAAALREARRLCRRRDPGAAHASRLSGVRPAAAGR